MIALACFHLNRSDLAVHLEGRSYPYPINPNKLRLVPSEQEQTAATYFIAYE